MPDPNRIETLRILILGRGKTGSAVAEIARERGHSVMALGSEENAGGKAIDAAWAARADVAIEFTTPEAAPENLRALLNAGLCVVVGTTGWYDFLPEMTSLAGNNEVSLLHGTNFSLGVQAFFRAARELARSLPEYALSIEETHHVAKKDAPSGTALALKDEVERVSQQQAQIVSHREGDAAGLHVLTVSSAEEALTLRHEAFSRRGFALGAVRAAEWLAAQPTPGVWSFADVAPLLR